MPSHCKCDKPQRAGQYHDFLHNVGMMNTNNWKYCSVELGGARYDYIYDVHNNEVYTQHFPGIAVQKFHMSCGLMMDPDTLKEIIAYKLGMHALVNTHATASYESLF